MRKSYVISTAGAAATLALGYWLKNKTNNEHSGDPGFMNTLEKAGAPDQMENEDDAHLENSKMVSEGSQFGVQYYNEIMDIEAE